MGNFFAELKRRHIYRVAAAYVIAAWVLLQVVNNVAPILDAPTWIMRGALLVLVVGFPVAVFSSWAFDGRATAHIADAPILVVGVLALAVGVFLYQQFGASEQQASAYPVTSLGKPPGVSLVVLPFANLSSDPEQEFFSDGMTEEITTALAKVPDLSVVARTSAFQFKGENKDMRAVGQALGASHLIEGSVRKAGTRLRITAQLIKAEDGTHLWSENYDRELTDIFAVQEEIATAIATALRAPLGLKPGEHLVSSRTIDAQSYEQYLRAKALIGARGASGAVDAFNMMEQVVAKNPDYAPAWAVMAGVYRRMGNRSRQEEAARKAVELDPSLPDAYIALGVFERGRQKLALAEDLYAKAFALDPNNASVLFTYANHVGAVGRVKEYLTIMQRLRALEPLLPLFNGNLSDALWLNGQNDAAIEILKALPGQPGELPPGMTPGGLLEIANIYASVGRYNEAANALLELSAKNVRPQRAAIAKDAARLLRMAPAESASPEELPRLGEAGFVYLYIGAPGRALEEHEERGETGFFPPGSVAMLWHPSYAPVRKMERFKMYVRKAGLVDYWRAKGWPDFCHPVSAEDFVCE